MEDSRRLSGTALRDKVEKILESTRTIPFSGDSGIDAQKIYHELEVHQIELEMQNEELRQANETVDLARNKYKKLFDFAPIGYFTLSAKGEIADLNITGAQMLGKERSKLINSKFGFFVSKDAKPIFNFFLDKIFKTKSKQSCELILALRFGHSVHLMLTGIIDNNDNHCLLTAVDITERKKTELQLKDSEERFRVASKAAGFGTFTYFFDNGKAFYSEEFLNLFELSAEESIELDSDLVAKAIHSDDRNRFLKEMIAANNPCGSGILDIEFRIVLKGEKIRWLRSRGLTTFSGKRAFDKPIHASGIVYDITSRKNAEAEVDNAKFALESQNELLSKLNLFSIRLSRLTNTRKLISEIAKHLKEITGAVCTIFSDYDSSSLKLILSHIEIEPGLREKVNGILGRQITGIQSTVSNEELIEITKHIIIKRKTLHEISFAAISVSDGTAIQKLLNIDRFFGLAYFVDDELFGTSILGLEKSHPDPHNDIMENFISICSAALQRNKTEKEKREKEEKWHSLFEILPVGVSIVDAKNEVNDFNRSLSNILDISSEGLLKGWYKQRQYLNPDYTLMSPEEFPSNRSLKENKIIKDVEIGVIKEDKNIIWTNVSASPLPSLNSTVTVTTDITQRKQAEEQLRKIKQLLSETEMIGKVGGWEFNIDTKLQTWTDEIYNIHEVDLDYNPNVDNGINFYAPESRPIIARAVQRVIELGEPFDLELEIITARGNLRKVHTIGKADLEHRRICGFFQDITEQKKAEDEIKESREQLETLLKHLNEVREEERTSIAREIHDDLGQLLAGLKIDLLGIKDNINEKPISIQRIDKAISHVSSSIQTVHRLSSQLRPQMLDELGLASAIEWQADEFKKRTGIKCKLELEEIEELGENIPISVFRIFQAALTNIMLHSKAKSVSVKLELRNEMLVLRIIDDGIGITQEQINSSKSFGIIGMRERTNHINGRYEILTEKGRGTEIIVSVPVKAVR